MKAKNTLRLLKYVEKARVFTIQDVKRVCTSNNPYDPVFKLSKHLPIDHVDVCRRWSKMRFRVYYLRNNWRKVLDYLRMNSLELAA